MRAEGIDLPRRILVFGVTGSGKSTLAAAVAERTGLPLHRVDELMWQPHWTPVPEDEQRALMEQICATDAWVLDHAYGSWRDVALARAELVVGLDYPRWVSASRLVRRTVRRLVAHEAACNGNHETLARAVGPDSILRWHAASFGRKRERIRAWASGADGPPTLRLTSPAQAGRWLRSLPRPGQVDGSVPPESLR